LESEGATSTRGELKNVNTKKGKRDRYHWDQGKFEWWWKVVCRRRCSWEPPHRDQKGVCGLPWAWIEFHRVECWNPCSCNL